MRSCFSAHTIDFYSDNLQDIPLTMDGITLNCFVLRVLDGDTVELCLFNPYSNTGNLENIVKKRCRLMGIYAPEIHTHDAKEKQKGLEAKYYLEKMIQGKTVKISFGKTDKYGRELGTIFFNGVNVNKLLMEKGLAREYFGLKKENWVFD